ncbi:MAG TPA: FAD-dependent oxidoreductase [Vicinamibacterales bacterium]|jgi:glycerol-3-phosphate dehydrogenase|nr:FAD-dependent oxidoreductase [Vicinamibacterales bacterium]
MRPREVAALTSREHDILIIGGGIYGLAIAYDAASRGLSVALVERGDFAAAASFNHQKTAHGGLRALQTGHVGRSRESIGERRALARMAPRLLRPLPFIIGTYRSVLRNRLAMRAAFKVDAWLGRHRNQDVEPELHLPAARLVSKAATLKLFPGVREDGLTGGAMWYDYQIVDTDRLALAFAAAADAHGARLANYVEALEPIRQGAAIRGMRVRDVLTGEPYDVGARLTINASGACAGDLMRRFGVSGEFLLLQAMNLVTTRPASDIALAAPSREGRMLTLTPWKGRALVGTGQSAEFKQPGDCPPEQRDVERFLSEVNATFPRLSLQRNDVTLVHCGVVPARRGQGGRPDLLAAPQILDHAASGAPGSMTVVGIKYTTARGVASHAVNAAARRLGRSIAPSRTDAAPLPGAGIADHEALAIETARAVGLELAPPMIRHLTSIYGDRCAQIIRLMAEHSEWRMPLVPGEPTIGAEIVYVIRDEMACTLSDIAIRRTERGSAGHPGEAMVAAMARVAADILGWDADRRNAEIAAVDRFYRI